jgi:hypothetical protein
MSGKYHFRVTHELIEMMETESKVIVNWSYDVNSLTAKSVLAGKLYFLVGRYGIRT